MTGQMLYTFAIGNTSSLVAWDLLLKHFKKVILLYMYVLYTTGRYTEAKWLSLGSKNTVEKFLELNNEHISLILSDKNYKYQPQSTTVTANLLLVCLFLLELLHIANYLDMKKLWRTVKKH